MKTKVSIFLILMLFLTGCYHAKVTTGAEMSAQVVENTFASGFIFGLVPPSVVNVASECTNGVAQVETRLSFVNMLVSNITFGLYTPMHIKVTCAASPRADAEVNPEQQLRIAADASEEDYQKVLREAAEKSLNLKMPVNIVNK